jgi:two-component system sensor histidine kinase KdpD
MLDTAAMTAARWAFKHNESAGAETGTLPAIPWYFLPLKTARGPLGVIGVAREERTPRLDSEAHTLLETLAEQTAAALDRASLAKEMVSARSAAETERVRNTLLASVSHDFRTPLASILGSATSLLDYGDKLDPQAQKELLGQIKVEAEDLDDMVRNLLAMTRIDAGALEVRRDWVDLRELVERVASASRRRGAPPDDRCAAAGRPAPHPRRCQARGAGARQCDRQRRRAHARRDPRRRRCRGHEQERRDPRHR